MPSIVRLFAGHRLASTLTMLLMLMAGIWAITQLSVRLNPVQPRNAVDIRMTWRGASAEDVEKLITNPLEQHLRTLPDVKSLRSTTRDTTTHLRVQFERQADIQKSVDQIKQRISQIRGFPVDMEAPVVAREEQRDLVAAVLITGPGNLEELIPVARDMESSLLARGADVIDFVGLPGQEIAIQVGSQTLFELGLSFDELGGQLSALSQDAPGGTIGRGQMSRQLRSLDQRRDAAEFDELPVFAPAGKHLVRLGEIATVEKRPRVDQPYTTVEGKPAIQMFVRRNLETDALDAAETLNAWTDSTRQSLPAGVDISLFLEAWVFIRDEIDLILENGITGLALVILALLVFLQPRVAMWVMLGIPITFLAALLAFYHLGGTINVLSLVGIIMALGIVVDDAIVVSEESLTQFDAGHSPMGAASLGAGRMFAPVIASSLTTLCAFLPLLSMEDDMIIEIPLMMLCVIIASLIECFLVLPGHLRHAFERSSVASTSSFRRSFNRRFENFRERQFRPMVRLAMQNRGVVIGGALCMFLLMLALWVTGWIKTELSLSINFDQVTADIQFVGGTSDSTKRAFIAHVEEQLKETDRETGGNNIVTFVTTNNRATINNEQKNGSQYASIMVELISPEKRNLSAGEFAGLWHDKVRKSYGVESFTIRKSSDFWSDFSILLKGADSTTLKQAGEELKAELAALDGVKNVQDDLPYGREQWVFTLTTEGRALGLSAADVGRQLRAAYDGVRVQIFQHDQTEMEVRLLLPENERTNLALLKQFPIKTPAGEMLPLANVVTLAGKRGIDIIRHHNAERTIKISGDVDLSVISGREVVGYFDENIKDELLSKYGIRSGLDEKSLAEQEAESDFGVRFIIALSLIYVVLAWIFTSWMWPLAVMASIPLGLTGALLGHFVMGMYIGPMSLLGLFTLTGIIVNDSIILVSAYKNMLAEGIAPNQAIEDAVCSRLRAVILTSLTTVAGLFPLMLEQAPIAAMFTPLAAAICFGMIYGTMLVLIVIPAFLSVIIQLSRKWETGSPIIAGTNTEPAKGV